MEASERPIILRHRAFALQHVNLHGRLIIRRGRECLRLFGRDSRISFDELCHHAAEGFDTERQRSNIEKKHVLYISREHTALDSRADSYDLIRVHAFIRLFTEDLFHSLLNKRDTRGSTDKNNLDRKSVV